MTEFTTDGLAVSEDVAGEEQIGRRDYLRFEYQGNPYTVQSVPITDEKSFYYGSEKLEIIDLEGVTHGTIVGSTQGTEEETTFYSQDIGNTNVY